MPNERQCYAVQRGKFIDIAMFKNLKSIKLSGKYKLVGTGQFQRRIGDNAIGHTTLFEYSPLPPLQPASLSALTSKPPVNLAPIPQLRCTKNNLNVQ